MSFLRDVLGKATDFVGLTDTGAPERALGRQKEAFAKAQELRAPYLDEGAIGRYRDFDPMESFQESPGYQHRLKEGKRALENALAARGMYGSSKAVKGLTDYVQGQAADEFDRYYQRETGRLKDLVNLDKSTRDAQAQDIYGMGREAAQMELAKNREMSGLLKDVVGFGAGLGAKKFLGPKFFGG